ncbi:MAG: D-alanyl-D-alanine carboxypeptidase [Treponema sp.]|nr:D-alanyl-D-alanine carboxypeptidase [Treponema sp.]
MKIRAFAPLFVFIFFPVCLFAQYYSTPPLLEPYIKNAPQIVSRAAVLIDAATGALIYSKNANEEIPPASLAKLMTMFLVMNEIKEGRACYDELIPVTVESWAQRQPRRSSLMFLEPGQRVTLRELLLGLAVSSGNDASVAVALRFARSMSDFGELMTAEAKKMGLNVTRFVEASGYSEQNNTTAQEFAYFCHQYIMKHPESLRDFHSVPSFSYPLAENEIERYRENPRTIEQFNRNFLLRRFSGVDGLKTGYIVESGYNIALTAQRDNSRFILILMGAPSERVREADGLRIFTWVFNNFETIYPPIAPPDNVPLWKGREKTVQLKYAIPAEFTSPVSRSEGIEYKTIIEGFIKAPLEENSHAGYLIISDEYGEIKRVPLVTAKAYEKGSFLKRIWHSFLLLFKRTLERTPERTLERTPEILHNL